MSAPGLLHFRGADRMAVENDYTKWHECLDEDLSIEEISQKAMVLRINHTEEEHQADKDKTPCR